MCYKFRPYVYICPFKLYFDPDTNNCQPWKSPKCHKPKPPIKPIPSPLPCQQTTPPPTTTTTLPTTTTTDSTTTTTKPQNEFRIAAEESSLESTQHIFSSTHPSKSTLQRVAPTPEPTTKQHSASTTKNILLKSVHHDALKQSTSSVKTENVSGLSKSESKSSKIPVVSKHTNNLLSTASPRSHNSNHLHMIPVSVETNLPSQETLRTGSESKQLTKDTSEEEIDDLPLENSPSLRFALPRKRNKSVIKHMPITTTTPPHTTTPPPKTTPPPTTTTTTTQQPTTTEPTTTTTTTTEPPTTTTTTEPPTTTTTPPTTTTTQSPIFVHDIPKCFENDHFRTINRPYCNIYYYCNHGRMSRYKCPEGYKFHQGNQACQHADTVDCV
ncbi:unnamed protein product [Colias eurytheme]|nr:unnamed protein product [Colias eurytheme]